MCSVRCGAREPARWLLALAALLAGAGVATAHRPRCPDLYRDRCRELESRGGLGEYPFVVDGERLLIQSRDGGSYQLPCNITVTLDNPALPRYEPELRVAAAHLPFCLPPASGGYGAALRRLGVRPLDKLRLNWTGRTNSSLRLRREDLVGLDLSTLVLERVALADDALVDLTNLTTLYVDGVRPPDEVFASLPRSLLNLHLVRVGTPPDSALRRLERLAHLTLRDPRPLAVRPTWPALTDLFLEANMSDVGRVLSPALVNLSMVLWAPEHPEAWEECASLERLILHDGNIQELPRDFVRRCPRLRHLDVQFMRSLSRLENGSLNGASELRELRVSRCGLETLPEGLLEDARNLEVVIFSNNRLQSLPNGLFAVKNALHTLDLSHNQLTTPTFERFTAVKSLRVLRLEHNPGLGDSCAADPLALPGVSWLRELSKLTELYLNDTGATTLCSDWRDLALLRTLDLGHNNVTHLACTDLEFGGGETPLDVHLGHNPLRHIYCTRMDYERAKARPKSRARLSLPALTCDCNVYWAALLQRASRGTATSVQCGHGPTTLANASLDSLMCATPSPDSATQCRTWVRPHLDSAPGTPHVLRVLECASAGLQRVPQLSNDSLWELHLSNNSIASLAPADLPPHLGVLDLRANLLTELDEATLTKLGNVTIKLADNPLACDCTATASLRRLSAIERSRLDYQALRCAAGGEQLDDALNSAAARCVSNWPLYVTGGFLLMGVLLVASVTLLPPARAWLKRALRGHLLVPMPIDGVAPKSAEGGACRWDLFFSFSHKDAEVAAALVAKLEAAGYRVCVHTRDWRPGVPIQHQIVESVRVSRVTVALVSRHSASSQWAGAEVEEALQRRSLVAVLLEPPDALPDAALRRYLATNTYLESNDPYFWSKLTSALGPPLATPTSPKPKDTDVTPLYKPTAEARRGEAALA